MKRVTKRVISKILARNSKEGIFNIIIWWEIRRILYNIIMLVVGIPAMILLLIVMEKYNPSALEPPDDFVPLLSIIATGILANIFYTFGWVSEILKTLLIKDRWPNYGPNVWLCGLCFSIFICIVPSALTMLFGIFK
jgi:hypothetical protein